MDNSQKDLGRMEAQIENLEKLTQKISNDLELVKQTLAEVRGGAKVVWFIYGLFGALLGWAAQFLPHFFKGH